MVLLFCQISCNEKKIDKIAIVTPIINAIKTIKIDSIRKINILECSTDNKINFCNGVSPPFFKGGDKEFKKFVAKNLIYPSSSLSGVVYVAFIIDKNGTVVKNCVKVSKSILPDEFNEEAIRIVRLLPNWTPAMQEGKPFKIRRRVPIYFEKNK